MAEIISGLAFLGNYMNNRQDKQELDINKKKLLGSKTYQKKSRNLFDNNSVNNISDSLNNKAGILFNKRQNPEKIGYVGSMYNYKPKKKLKSNIEQFTSNSNSDSAFSDDKSCGSNSHCSNNSFNGFDTSHFMKKEDKMLNNRQYEKNIALDKNNYASQFENLTFDNNKEPVSVNDVPSIINNGNNGNNGTIARIENDRKLALNGGYSNFDDQAQMSYGVIKDNELTHNNMNPSFKGKDMNPFRNQQLQELNQRRMELFSGSDNRADFQHRKETKPLFSNLTNMTNIYGTPVMTDFYESRYMPSKERRNELPFQPVKITPGLGLGTNEQGNYGYHDPHRILPKTVDELRPKNKPKLSYKGVVVPGQKGSNGKIQGKQINKKPLTYRENGPNDVVKSGGYISAPAIVGEFDPKNMATQNRGIKKQVRHGAATYFTDKNIPQELQSKMQETHRENFTQAEPRNIQLVDGLLSRPDNKPFIPKTTQRAQSMNYLGPVNTNNKNQTVNYNDVPSTNMRNVHEDVERTNGIQTNNYKNQAINYNDVPNTNMRNVHEDAERTNGIQTNNYKNQSINYNDVPNTNMRNVHEDAERTKGIQTNNYKNQSINYNDVPNTNMRNVHENTERTNGIQTNNYKNQTVDYNDVPELNVRNTYNYSDIGPGQAQNNKNKTINYNDVPDLNVRNTYNYSDVGPGQAQNNKNKTINYNDVPDITLREIQGHTNRVTSAKGKARPSPRDDIGNMTVNVVKEDLSKGRTPTYSNYSKGPTSQFTEYTFNNKSPNNVRQNAPTPIVQSTDHLKQKGTHIQQMKWYVNNGEDRELLEDTLDHNILINNMVHQSKKLGKPEKASIERIIPKKGTIIYY